METTVTDEGQLTLPKAIRDRFGYGPGTRLAVEADDDGTVRLRALPGGSEGLYGRLAAVARVPASGVRDAPAPIDESMEQAVRDVLGRLDRLPDHGVAPGWDWDAAGLPA